MEHRTRARALEEQIALWRTLWSGAPVSQEGRGFTLTEHTIGPLPWTEEGPPILITAGNRGALFPAQLRRLGRLGDGIITTYVSPEDCVRLRERGAAALAEHGRPSPDFPLCVYTTVRLDDDVATAERVTEEFIAAYYGGSTGTHQRGLMGLGPADVVISALKQYEAAGVTDLCIRFSGEDQRQQLDRFSREVLPAFA
jgi:alkanesulfonate monooxygenase SsuD/methylene tetrahydromethanopterin reductase-like flavin-dependent oxidoreductase (luciferase family)